MADSPSKSLRTQASRSRFHEGSMNDKVSAVPPVQFLGPEEQEALERPLEFELQQYLQQRMLHPLQKAHSQIQIHLQTSSLSLAQAQTHTQSHFSPHSKAPSVYKKGGNLIGQVWEGMRDKLKLRKDSNPPNPAEEFQRKRAPGETPTKRPDIDRPTREETLATYHQLMASGFFTQHAIQSTRHARPATIRPPCSRGSLAPSYISAQQPEFPYHAPPPQWSLPMPRTPTSRKQPCSPFATPGSIDSRGLKRAADENPIRIHVDNRDSDDDDDDIRVNNDHHSNHKSHTLNQKTRYGNHSINNNNNNHNSSDSNRSGSCDRNEINNRSQEAEPKDSALPARPTTPQNKVRKITTKNLLPLAQLSGAKSKLRIARRTPSSTSIKSGNLPPIIVQKRQPSSKARKGAQTPADPASPSPSPSRKSFDVLAQRRHGSTTRRNVSETYYSVRAVGSGSMTSRTQKPREGDGLNAVHDANRGIPRVPLIPTKYATGYEDKGENREMWRSNCQLIS